MKKSQPGFSRINPLTLASSSNENDLENEDEDQLLLREDIDSSHLKRNRRSGKQVRLDFDSDSSDDGETRRDKDLIAQRKREEQLKNKGKSTSDDDDDMFSDDDDEEEKKDETADEQKKGVELLNMAKFEEEEEIEVNDDKNSEDLGNDEDEVTETNVDIAYFTVPDEMPLDNGESEFKDTINSEDRIVELDPDTNEPLPKKSNDPKKKPKQEPKLEGFHLRDDLEEGQFDVDGNFIRNAADENAHQDLWLEGVSKRDILKARKAHLERLKADDAIEQTQTEGHAFIPKTEYISRLVELLNLGETPLEALQEQQKKQLAYKKALKAKFRRGNQSAKKKAGGAAIEESEEDIAKRKERQKLIEEITECTDTLLQRGMTNIYDMTREELMREYKNETGETYTLKRKRAQDDDEDDEDVTRESLENEQQEQEQQSNHGDEDEYMDLEPNTMQWQLKWEGSDEIHGPYDSATMRSWIRDAYLDSRATVREYKADDDSYTSSQPFVPYDSVQYL